ncbi:MAG TPA: acylphosphatase [Mycobacteriales bacterium]|nr:acylphosphatase [Mycobacteriales bacterium]
MGGDEEPVRVTAWVRGRVQQVGFRWWVRSRALEAGLVGWARNLPDGRVEVVAEGSRDRCHRLLETLSAGGSPGRVDTVVDRWSTARGGIDGFTER